MIRRDSAFAVLLLLAVCGPALAAEPASSSPSKPARPAAQSRPVQAKPAPAPAQADFPPVDQATLIAQARAASAKGDNDLALRMAQSAIVADPSKPLAYDALGDVYAANHQPDFARNYYEEALSIDPSDAAATRAIATLDRAGDTRKADASADGAKPGIP